MTKNVLHNEGNLIESKNKLNDGSSFKISRFKEVIKKTLPHKHDEYFEIIFLHEGEGFHWIESEKHMVTVPEIYILRPGQLHFWQFTSIPKGFVILFKEKEFNQIREGDLMDAFTVLAQDSRIGLNNESYPISILSELLAEHQEMQRHSSLILHGLLRVFFGKFLNHREEDANPGGGSYPASDRFQALLIKECPRLHKVTDYANLLNVTPQNLNAVCRRQIGSSAGELIHKRLLLEAKRYLLYTDNTVAEIAEILNFSDASNFNKYFRKQVGMTPLQFRGSHFQ